MSDHHADGAQESRGGGALWWILGGAGSLAALAIMVVLVMVLSLASMMAGHQQQQLQAMAACRPVSSGSDGVTDGAPPAPAQLREEQIRNARAINGVVEDLGLPGRAAEIAIIAAMGESTLINVDYGDQRFGVTNPDGSAATSYGLFQQQTSQGWGTKEQVMDPEYATRSFLLGQSQDGSGGLVSVDGWQDREITLVIHDVQRNSDANHYANSYAAAREIMQAADIDTSYAGDEEKMKELGADGGGGGGRSGSSDGCFGGRGPTWDGDLGDGEWTIPLPNSHVSSAGRYGPRNIPGYPDWANDHDGVDLLTSDANYGLGGPVVAPAPLEVIGIYEPDGCVQARLTGEDDSPRFGMAFCHLGEMDVSTGDRLERGDIIGTEGNQGENLGNPQGGRGFVSHLHFEIYDPGMSDAQIANPGTRGSFDPLPILEKKGAAPGV